MTMKTFPAPEMKRPRPRVQPVFIPFQGCAVRCVFCAQTLQTGESARTPGEVLAGLAADLERAVREKRPPRELAFYGGTFTALEEKDQFAFLELAGTYRQKGIVTGVRASTRPDRTPPFLLAALRDAGLDMLELGAQSFADAPLAASGRGYGGKEALAGCARVKESGLTLGIQLMPGMPGMADDDFRRDVATTLALAPAAVRFYPCLVLAGTELAAMHGRGQFMPWPLDRTTPLLAEAQLAFWRAGIPVIRMGLAAQDGLDQGGVLAGPAHPALGSMVRGLALYRYIREKIEKLGLAGAAIAELALPRYLQGDFWGHGGSLEADYASLGIRRGMVSWQDRPDCAIRIL